MTYIEKPKYHEKNRVFILKRITGKLAIGYMLDLDAKKYNPTTIRLPIFRERFERCWLEMG